MTPCRSPHNRPVLITLPLPPADLSPNTRKDRRQTTATRRGYREHACLLAIAAQGSHRRQWTAATVAYRFYLPDRRRRDIDNLIAAAKPVLDGLQDARVIADDSGVLLSAERYLDPTWPRLEVEVCMGCLAGPHSSPTRRRRSKR